MKCRACGSERIQETKSIVAVVVGARELYCLDCTISYCEAAPATQEPMHY